MRNVLSTLIAAVFAAVSITAIAADAPKAGAGTAVETKKNDNAAGNNAQQGGMTDPAGDAKAASNINSINAGMPNRISMTPTVGKQTQGATFGEKVNAGLHAAGSALSQGASLLGGALPGGAVISAAAQHEADTSDASASAGASAVSSVGNLAGGAGGGAAAASYAKVSAAPDVAPAAAVGPAGGGAAQASYAATGISTAPGVAPAAAVVPKAGGNKAPTSKTKHDTAKNSVGNIR